MMMQYQYNSTNLPNEHLHIRTESSNAGSGYLRVLVNSGDGNGYVNVIPLKKHSSGSVVLNKCYPGLVGVRVANPESDGWIGSIETSVNNGITYAPMVCIDKCTPGGATSSIAVDGDSSNFKSEIVVRCLNGETCTLALPDSSN